jgi:hypothetical protein
VLNPIESGALKRALDTLAFVVFGQRDPNSETVG